MTPPAVVEKQAALNRACASPTNGQCKGARNGTAEAVAEDEEEDEEGGSLTEAYLDRNCFDLGPPPSSPAPTTSGGGGAVPPGAAIPTGVPHSLRRVRLLLVNRQRAPPAPAAPAALSVPPPPPPCSARATAAAETSTVASETSTACALSEQGADESGAATCHSGVEESKSAG